MASIPCIVDMKGKAAARARYALEMLLLPIGLRPHWVDRPGDCQAGLYYGPGPTDLPGTWLTPAFSREAVRTFDSRTLPSASRFECEGRFLPMVFPVDPAETQKSHHPPFDLIAGAFFWLSGFQEWAVPDRDTHGRFPYAASVQRVMGTPQAPVVDACRGMLAHALTSCGFPVRLPQWGGRSWALCPTHDVDYLRKYRPGIWYREMVENLLLGRRRGGPRERSRRLWSSLRQAAAPDPYRRSIIQMVRAVSERGGSATWFFKAGSHEPYDVPYGLTGPFIQNVFRDLRDRGFGIGLHPSYFASVHSVRTRNEKQRLEEETGGDVRAVRMHYLRYSPHIGPILHEQAGFRIDATLGFAEHEGFRRGTCLPFRVYDLVEDRPTGVWEMPLHVMDSTLFGYRGLGFQDAMEATASVMKACREAGGLFVCLWHPVLWDELDFPGWREHFDATLEAAVREDGAILSLESAHGEWEHFIGTI